MSYHSLVVLDDHELVLGVSACLFAYFRFSLVDLILYVSLKPDGEYLTHNVPIENRCVVFLRFEDLSFLFSNQLTEFLFLPSIEIRPNLQQRLHKIIIAEFFHLLDYLNYSVCSLLA